MKKIATLILVMFSAAAHADYDSCMAAIGNNPKYATLKQKVAMTKPSDQTFAMIANNTFAASDEKPLIADWVTDRNKCFIDNEHEFSNMSIALQTLLNKQNLQFQSMAADLYNKKITYGDFAKIRAEMAAEFKMSLQTLKDYAARECEEKNAIQKTNNKCR
jgi:hypothetical protein